MAKFYGKIGFVQTIEDPDNLGVWTQSIIEKSYSGDMVRVIRRLQTTASSTNDNITISNEISIVADPYAQDNMFAMRYIIIKGIKWKIETIEVEYPRLKLSIGGIYNE